MRKNNKKNPVKNKAIRIIISLIISIVLVFYFLKEVSLKDILAVFSSINLVLLIPAFILYVLLIHIRSIRLRMILNNNISRLNSFKVMAINNLFINILPFRLGELSFLYLLKKSGIKVRKSLASLLVLRMFDFIALVLIFLIGFLFLKSSLNIPLTILLLIILLLFISIFLTSIFIFKNSILMRLFKKIITVLHIEKKRTTRYVTKKLGQLFNEARYLKKQKLLWMVMLTSIIMWMIIPVMIFVFYKSMNIDFPFFKTVIASTFQLILSVIPVQGLANFGTFEAYWVIGFTLLGMAKSTAIIAAFNIHILQLINTLILALLSWLLIKKK